MGLLISGHSARCFASACFAGCLAFALYATTLPHLAYAAEAYTASPLNNAGQYGIEALAETYEIAKAHSVEASAKAAESQAHIEELQVKVDAQQERTDAAMRDMYVMEQSKLSLIDAMLDARSFDDLVKYADYIERVSRVNTTELNALKDLRAELEAEHVALEQARQEAEAQEVLAQEALRALQDQRATKAQAAKATDGADWYMSKDDFVAEWAPRIDAYFSGTAMAGTGESFAIAAWRNCIDPRWSPAISNIESSKGAVCIRPFNAWGWGAADSDPYNLAAEWSSWDEAINAHVRGLARGYGYTITEAAAKTYCPPNWEHWYEVTVAEMAKI